METEKLKSVIESLLFVSGEPVKTSKLAKIIGAKNSEIEKALMLLDEDYSDGRGLAIIRKGGEVQMGTKAENANFVEKIVKNEIQENISRAGLEVLSIVAYRGPISRVDIEAIRGVNCSFTLRSLMMRGLLEREGNPEGGRGYLYSISFEFLKKLGLKSLVDLPDYETLSREEKIESIIN